MRSLLALVGKDLRWSMRELEFLVYIAGPLLAALCIQFVGPLLSAPPEPPEVVVFAGPGEGALVDALRAEPTLDFVGEAPDWPAAKARVDRREAVTAVHLPGGLSARLGTDPPPTVELHHDTRSIAAFARARRAVTGVVERFTRPLPPAVFAETYASGADTPFSLQAFLIEVALSFSLLFTGVFVVPMSLAEEREKGPFEALLLAGTSVRTLLAAKVAYGLLTTCLVSVLLVGLTAGPAVVLPALAHVLPGAACFVSIGLATALMVRTRKQAELAAALVMFVVAVPPLAAQASPAMARFAAVSPMALLTDGLRAALTGQGQPLEAWLREAAVLTAFTVAAFALAAWRARRLET